MKKTQLIIHLIISIVVLSQAEQWFPQIDPQTGLPSEGGGMTVDYVFYQTESTANGHENGYIFFYSKSEDHTYKYLCKGTSEIDVTKFKSILSTLLIAKTHGYKVYLHSWESDLHLFDGVFLGD